LQNLKSRSSILAAAERSHRTLNILKRRAERWKKVGRLKRREDKTLSRKESKRSVTRSKRWGFSPFFGKWQDLFAFAM
jgi:chorismate mutase